MTINQMCAVIDEEWERIYARINQNSYSMLERDPRRLFKDLNVRERYLYLVGDVSAITRNAGIGAWIDYHIDDAGWVDEAIRGFEEINQVEIALAVEAARDLYLSSGDNTSRGFVKLSEILWDRDNEVITSLYNYYFSGSAEGGE